MRRLILGLLTSSIVPAASLANPHDTVRNSLLVLRIEAQDSTGRRIEAYGTGFVISKSGYALTAAHVTSDLIEKGAIQATMKVYARVKDTTANEALVEVVGRGLADVMVIKLPQLADEYIPLKLKCVFRQSDRTGRIFSSGFHNACTRSSVSGICEEQRLVRTTGEGQVTSTDGVQHSLWATDLPFSGGNSGSPVYDSNGYVVGLAKGVLASGNNINYFTPITFARSLIGDLPEESACTQVKDSPLPKVYEPASSAIDVEDSVRVGGTGPQVGRKTETKKVCYQAPPGWTIIGEIKVDNRGNNGGRGSVSAVQYDVDADNRSRVSNACVTISAWSEDNPFGAGGWQSVRLTGIATQLATPGEACEGLPGETAWIYGGEINRIKKHISQGPFVESETIGTDLWDIQPGTWIRLTQQRRTMILDYASKGLARALDSPFRLDGTVSYTCRTLGAGERVYVAEKEVRGPSGEVQHVWFRIRRGPPGG